MFSEYTNLPTGLWGKVEKLQMGFQFSYSNMLKFLLDEFSWKHLVNNNERNKLLDWMSSCEDVCPVLPSVYAMPLGKRSLKY